jgi:single-strand DNA-binding protein
MYNRVILMGRICHDLELKSTPNGVPVLSFRIAVDRNYQVKGEERKADFFSVVAWRSTAEFVSKYFAKGRMVMVDGELQARQYVDKNNVTQNIVEVVANSVHFTGEKANNNNQGGGGYNGGGNGGGNYGSSYQNSAPPAPHPAETANSAPAAVASGGASDFAGSGGGGDEDDYPF